MSVAVDIDLEQRVVELVEAQRPGISAVELATEHNGLLQPTSRAIELGTTLELG